jgi:hypothetical protein
MMMMIIIIIIIHGREFAGGDWLRKGSSGGLL